MEVNRCLRMECGGRARRGGDTALVDRGPTLPKRRRRSLRLALPAHSRLLEGFHATWPCGISVPRIVAHPAILLDKAGKTCHIRAIFGVIMMTDHSQARSAKARTVSESEGAWAIVEGEGPIAAAAIHDGHELRPEIRPLLALSEETRLREEDPCTAGWTEICGNRIHGLRSRFEVDLNRPADACVYLAPEQAWGLEVFREQPSPDVMARTMDVYDGFYLALRGFFEALRRRHGVFVVLDLHTYNHRREGPVGPVADPAANPEVNVGTGTLRDREKWDGLIRRFVGDLRAFDFGGRQLDVRENVRFRGGHFPRWVHGMFEGAGCCLAIEVKKFFMDEWSGTVDEVQWKLVREALASTLPGLRESLVHNGVRNLPPP